MNLFFCPTRHPRAFGLYSAFSGSPCLNRHPAHSYSLFYGASCLKMQSRHSTSIPLLGYTRFLDRTASLRARQRKRNPARGTGHWYAGFCCRQITKHTLCRALLVCVHTRPPPPAWHSPPPISVLAVKQPTISFFLKKEAPACGFSVPQL